jgi:hypothetical protein
MLSNEDLKAAVRELQAAAAKLGKELQRAEDMEALPLAVAFVEVEKIKGSINKLAKKIIAPGRAR